MPAKRAAALAQRTQAPPATVRQVQEKHHLNLSARLAVRRLLPGVLLGDIVLDHMAENERLDFISEAPKPQSLQDAEKRADLLAQFTLASVRLSLDALIDEVSKMNIAERFSGTRRVVGNQSDGRPPMVISYVEDPDGKTVKEIKRKKLIEKLEKIKGDFEVLGDRLNKVVLDIEATKQD